MFTSTSNLFHVVVVYQSDKELQIESFCHILQWFADKYGLNISYPDEWMNPSREVVEEEKETSKAQQVAKQNIIPQMVYEKIKSCQEGKTKPKDIALPVRAAIEAGLMSQISHKKYLATGLKEIKRASYYGYTNLEKSIYTDKFYERMLEEFKQLSNNVK